MIEQSRSEVEHLEPASLDIAAKKRDELLTLFPEARTEGGKIDFDRLQLALGQAVDTGKERYGLTWPGKTECYKTLQTGSMATLLPAPEESIEFDSSANLIIEGDNLEVLKLLQKSYLGQVKMIYIDPPYNSGSDLVYPDSYAESLQTYLRFTGQADADGRKFGTNSDTSGRFHSNWLSMMYSRLYLARNLLRDDGVIIISVDDREHANLRKICDEIFGEENFVGTFVVNSTPNARDYGHIAKMHEYALLFSKHIEHTQTSLLPSEDKSFRFLDDLGDFNIHPLYNSNTAFHAGNRPNLFYPFYLEPQLTSGNTFYQIGLEKTATSIEIFPPKSQKQGVQFVWRWGRSLAQTQLNKEIVGYKTEDGDFRIVQKMRHNSKIIRSLLLDTAFSTRRGTAEVEDLFGEKIFTFPKSMQLIKTFCQSATSGDDIVLDFFAGSGTTAHAVLELNKQDHGKRRFILVQLPEPTGRTDYPTLFDVCKERVRRVISRLNSDEQELRLDPEQTRDRGFRVFKLAQSNIKEWETFVDRNVQTVQEQLGLSVDHVRHDRSELDIVYEVLLKSGYPLSAKVSTETINGTCVYTTADGAFLICLDRHLTLDLIRAIAAREPERVLFLDAGFAGNDQLKTNAVQTFKNKNVDLKTL